MSRRRTPFQRAPLGPALQVDTHDYADFSGESYVAHVGESGPTTGEWLESLKLLEGAIEDAKLVSNDFMIRVHPELSNMWQSFLIPSMEKIHSYYFKAVDDPDSVKSPSTQEGLEQLNILLEANNLDSIFGDWYNQNRDAMRDSIRRMAE